MNTDDTITHKQAIELLPWLVNDSLPAGERDLVLGHARSCVICRRELDELQRLRQLIDAAHPAVVPDPDMRRINQRIDRLLADEKRPALLIARVRELFSSPLRVAVALQAVMLLVLGGLLLRPDGSAPEFSTLTTPADLPAGRYLRAVFDPDLPGTAIETLLDGNGLAIVDGPSPRGVYTLSYTGTTTAEERAKVLTALQEHSQVLFADQVGDAGR